VLKLPHSGWPALTHLVAITGPCGGFKGVDGEVRQRESWTTVTRSPPSSRSAGRWSRT
jgi:hypothetical protein